MLIETAENGRYVQVYTGVFTGFSANYSVFMEKIGCINPIRHQNIWLYRILLCCWTVAHGSWLAEYC